MKIQTATNALLTPSHRKAAVRTALIAAFALAFAAPSWAADTAGAAGDPQAAALLAKAVSTLRSASTLHADFEQNDLYPTPYRDLAQRGSVTLARPGLLRVDIKRYRRVTSNDAWAPSGNNAVSASDGTTYTYAFLHPSSSQVLTTAASDDTIRDSLKVVPAVADFFPAGQSGIDPAAGAPTLAPKEQWEGDTYQVVAFTLTQGGRTYDTRAYVGADSLIHRLVYRVKSPQGDIVKEFVLRHITLDAPVKSAVFAYKPPVGSTPLDTNRRSALLAPGQIAPDFSVTDSHGHPVKLSDFRGKTVVLDFWATWCWPCNQSLPHLDAVAHDNRSKNVVVLAVAIWDSKAGFNTWIRKHHYQNINFAIDPSPQGKDIASALYHVGTTPTAYVIGPDGAVLTAISGYTGPTNDLQAAINTATQQTAKATP